MDNNELVAKFQEMKTKLAELTAEKLKYAKWIYNLLMLEQLNTEIKSIQDKYSEYDLSTTQSVENIISKLTINLSAELEKITNQYNQLKVM